MDLTTLKISGDDAIRLLDEHRSRFPATGLYPFLIGGANELERLEENAGFRKQDASAIIRASLDIEPATWAIQRRKQMEQTYGLSFADTLGEWPEEIGDEEIDDHGSIMLHRDLASGRVHPEVYLGLAKIEEPWHLPAIVKFGSWNDCPGPEVHCAFHRCWQERYGAEITGMSGDIVECTVKDPPNDREAATALAWEQYWYCVDIVEQGAGSVSDLAAGLLDSAYWSFWWD